MTSARASSTGRNVGRRDVVCSVGVCYSSNFSGALVSVPGPLSTYGGRFVFLMLVYSHPNIPKSHGCEG